MREQGRDAKNAVQPGVTEIAYTFANIFSQKFYTECMEVCQSILHIIKGFIQ